MNADLNFDSGHLFILGKFAKCSLKNSKTFGVMNDPTHRIYDASSNTRRGVRTSRIQHPVPGCSGYSVVTLTLTRAKNAIRSKKRVLNYAMPTRTRLSISKADGNDNWRTDARDPPRDTCASLVGSKRNDPDVEKSCTCMRLPKQKGLRHLPLFASLCCPTLKCREIITLDHNTLKTSRRSWLDLPNVFFSLLSQELLSLSLWRIQKS